MATTRWSKWTAMANVTSFDTTAAPIPQTGGGKIVFASSRDGFMQIYVMDSDGTGQLRLTTDGTNNENPRWSPDGTKILFQSDRDNPGSGLRDIYVMNSNGSGQARLTTDPNDDCFASWSADGTKIVFQSFRNGVSYQIYTMNADGSGQVNLSNNGVSDMQPSWSPDGTKIAFASERDQPGFPSIYVMNSNGTNQTRLTFSGTGLRDEQPVWSPNGTKLAFTSTRDSVLESWQETDDYEIPEDDGQVFNKSRLNINKEVYVMNTDGSGQTRLTFALEHDDSPAWSPDGTKIVFRSERERDAFDPTPQIWTMNSDGSGQINLSNSGDVDLSPSWATGSANQAPIANAGGPYSGIVGQAVTFNGSGSFDPDGTIISYSWTFGDGTNGSGATPTHTYASAGTHTAALTVADNSGNAGSTTGSVTITANTSPTVSITSPANGASFTAAANITITANASDTDGTISKVDFYRGTTLMGTDTISPYSFSWINVAAGNYSLTAKATDNLGATSTSAAVSVTVNVNGAPTVSITSPAVGASFTAPASITITANASDTDGTISKVDFYQGTTLMGTDTISPYSFSWNNVAAGSYTLTATATDNSGASGSASRSVTVTPGNQPPVANAGGPYSGVVGQNAAFSGSGSVDPDGSIVSYAWTFGDGGTGSGVAPTHAYGSTGTYTVTVTVTDNLGAQASASTTISVSASTSDQYVTSFLQWGLGRAPTGAESTYWTDIMRAAYPQGLPSMKLATRELGMTVFESAEYAARNRNDHWYVYDL
ncbi:MAG: PKD domain-containing protein, partial [Pyrinomonadaceae bacterium]